MTITAPVPSFKGEDPETSGNASALGFFPQEHNKPQTTTETKKNWGIERRISDLYNGLVLNREKELHHSFEVGAELLERGSLLVAALTATGAPSNA